ncbi:MULTISPECIES: hypothetical protein [Nocardioides]|uniref:Uncharacterized protein n=1 Tax=Nocardioides vastitatis TaxID=2568655 RepID=A0ABW0ZIW2_9ACTN|nr:hypothetical protein [Nocardioides sp.]THJ06259.1 hypothetical protein E7Z54_06505 [Nocardioides sp.]
MRRRLRRDSTVLGRAAAGGSRRLLEVLAVLARLHQLAVLLGAGDAVTTLSHRLDLRHGVPYSPEPWE